MSHVPGLSFLPNTAQCIRHIYKRLEPEFKLNIHKVQQHHKRGGHIISMMDLVARQQRLLGNNDSATGC